MWEFEVDGIMTGIVLLKGNNIKMWMWALILSRKLTPIKNSWRCGFRTNTEYMVLQYSPHTCLSMFPRRFPVNRVHGPPGKNERDKRNKEGSLSSCTATAPSPCLSLMSSIVRGRLRWEWERWAELSLCGPHRDDHHKRLFHRRFSPLNLRRPNNEHQSTTRVVEWTCSLGRTPGAQTCNAMPSHSV